MQELKTILLELLSSQKELTIEQQEMRECQIRMEADLKHHIKRTNQLEEMVKPVHKIWVGLKFIGSLLAIGSLILGLIYSFQRLEANEFKAKQPTIKSIYTQIQSEVPCKIKIHSWHRSKADNERVGGAPKSYHLKGRAMDISAKCVSLQTLAQIAYKHATVIIYKSHIHIDNRLKRKCLVATKGYYRYCVKKGKALLAFKL